MLRLAGALFLLGALTACQTNSIRSHPEYRELQDEVGRVIESVRASTGSTLVPNLQRLVAYDVFAVEQVSDLAEDPNPRLRCNAIWVLSQIQDMNYPEIGRQIDDILWDSLKDSDRMVRYEAASGLLTRNHWEVIPVLLDGMNDADPLVRRNCHDVLRQVTNNDFGYLADGDASRREEAVARWRAWYEGHDRNG